jgi:hypothetical protein
MCPTPFRDRVPGSRRPRASGPPIAAHSTPRNHKMTRCGDNAWLNETVPLLSANIHPAGATHRTPAARLPPACRPPAARLHWRRIFLEATIRSACPVPALLRRGVTGTFDAAVGTGADMLAARDTGR